MSPLDLYSGVSDTPALMGLKCLKIKYLNGVGLSFIAFALQCFMQMLVSACVCAVTDGTGPATRLLLGVEKTGLTNHPVHTPPRLSADVQH